MAQVKIKKLPTYSTGRSNIKQTSSGAVDTGTGFNQFDTPGGTNGDNIRTVHPKAKDGEANVEIELGEYVVVPNMAGLFKAGGKKHSKGGTKIKADPGAYIVSDHIKTNAKVLDMLELESKTDKKQTWAGLLGSIVDPKQYNRLTALISDKAKGKDVDNYALSTAKNKLPDLQTIVSKVALGNELTKAMMGKEYSIPQIATLAMEGLQPQEGAAQPETMMKDGGLFKAWRGKEIDPYLKSITPEGSSTPTNINNHFNRGPEYLQNWEQFIPGISKLDNKTAQSAIYDYQLKKDPGAISRMWSKYGITNEGRKYKDLMDMTFDGKFKGNLHREQIINLKKAYVDGMFGARQMDPTDYSVAKVEKTIPGATAPNLDFSKYRAPQINYNQPGTPAVAGTGVDPAADPQFVQGKQQGIGPNAFDVMALTDAATSPTNTYYPWAAKPDAAYVKPQFEEPNYYAIQAAQKQRMDYMNQNTTASMARAVGSYQPDQISGIMQETQRARGNNMQAAQQAQMANAQTYNTNSTQVAGINTQLYDKTVMSREQRDIAKRLKSQDTRGAAQNMVNNQTQMQYFMAENPQMGVSGPFWNKINFNGNGKSLDTPGNSTRQGATVEDIKAQFPGATPAELATWYKIYNGLPSNDSVTQTYDGFAQGTPKTTRIKRGK